jgi:crotonobetainyl-CoA:carnitine CoA-transferase CaiB-like acyl-CoA transferase
MSADPMLYIPGSEPGKLAKLPGLPTTAFILDLEDAVAASAKRAARAHVARALADHGAARRLFVRVNAVDSGHFRADLEAIVQPGLSGIVLPKAGDARDVQIADWLLGELEAARGLETGSVALLPTIETAAGVAHADAVATASPRIVSLGFGAGDMSLDVGVTWPPADGRLGATLLAAKASVVLAARRAGLPAPHDGAYALVEDLAGLRREAEEARGLGFGSKHAIHPRQVAEIAAVFAPGAAELERARRIVAAFDAAERDGVAALTVDGALVDHPVAERARRVLAANGAHPAPAAAARPAVRPHALGNLRVLDLSSLYAGPLIATNLGDFGAEVIKVEHPRGDDLRRWGEAADGVPLWWKVVSRNKRVIALDLHEPEARATVRRLVADADVLIENFRPGRMEEWGLGPSELEAINPRLVMARVTGFGQDGPNRSQPGFGTLAEAFSGFAFVTGHPDGPPTLPPFGLADGVAAMAGTYAVLTALYWRDAAGGQLGQVIDLSLYEPLFSLLGPLLTEYAHLGVVQQRQGNRSPRTAPRNAYRTADGHWVAISAGTQQIAQRIFVAIGRPELGEDPRFADAAARRAHADEADALVAAWIAAHDRDAVLARFAEVQAPIAPVQDARQIAQDPHFQARASFVEAPDPELGRLVMPNIVARLSRTPGEIRWTGPAAIGADTEAVLGERPREEV